ncbi:Crp/Fnr family transcriptional regulator [Sphingomonas cynarae]|uniref:Crp/Fnr family transcriptional regulator n=1 Tax=Sphingomonas cynarae TaxID=930197 RepID=A0ABP7CX54_9SPHN
MDNPLIVRFRRQCHLDAADVDRIDYLCTDVRDVPRGVNLVREGERVERIHLILSGWAARYKLLPNGSRQITALLLPGDLCDLRCSMLARMDDGIVALTPIHVAFVPPDAITRLERTWPSIAHALSWYCLVEQATTRAWIVNMGRRHALERVAHLFCELSTRLAVVSDAPDQPPHFPLTQEEIADALGLTAVHVNRVLHELRRREFITSRRGGLTILDLPGLKEMAGFNDNYLHPAMAMPTEAALG